MKNFDFRDFALRGLFLLAGGIAAALLVLKGYGPAMPGLALGGIVGAVAMTRFGPSEG